MNKSISGSVLRRRCVPVVPCGSLMRSVPLFEESTRREMENLEARNLQLEHKLKNQARGTTFGNILKLLVGGMGWVLFASTLYSMNELFSFLQFLDVAFPRKWHSLRLCFDLMPPEEKMRLVNEFRKLQLNGYDDSLFDYIKEYHQKVLSANGLTPEETLRRLNYVSRLIYEQGEEAQERWVSLVKTMQQRQNMTQGARLEHLLAKAPEAIYDKSSLTYPGPNIYDNMVDAASGAPSSSPSSSKGRWI